MIAQNTLVVLYVVRPVRFFGEFGLELGMHEQQAFRTGCGCRHSNEQDLNKHAVRYPAHRERHAGQKGIVRRPKGTTSVIMRYDISGLLLSAEVCARGKGQQPLPHASAITPIMPCSTRHRGTPGAIASTEQPFSHQWHRVIVLVFCGTVSKAKDVRYECRISL